jgi:hypothetical protein
VVKKAESGYAGSMRKHDSARTDEDEDTLADTLPGALDRDLPGKTEAIKGDKGDRKKSDAEKDVYGDFGNDLAEEPVPEPPD